MAVSQNILGMNARNYLYIRKYNYRSPKRIADDKLRTKRRLIRNNIATPKLLATFRSQKQIKQFDWSSLPEKGFAIKPARGYGGGGILVFQKWNETEGLTVSHEELNLDDIETHILDILDGAYSLQYLPDYAFIEERITLDPFFKKFGTEGLPDIRIIVLNNIPVMAMMRMATEQSKGTANLAQGAIALGIDIRTGITNFAYKKHGKPSRFLPGTKIKVRGIKIPKWDDMLLLAAKAQQVSKLGYAGIDIVVDAKKGPQVLEVNARPGLSIQNANKTSLRTRLERVENLKNVTAKRGVEMAKSLFTSTFSDKVQTKPKTVGVVEQIVLEGEDKIKAVEAKIDTGAFRTSVDKEIIKELGYEIDSEQIYVKSATGEQFRKGAKITFYLKGRKIKTLASVADRSEMQYAMIVGRRDMKGFVVDPTKNSPTESSKSLERKREE